MVLRLIAEQGVGVDVGVWSQAPSSMSMVNGGAVGNTGVGVGVTDGFGRLAVGPSLDEGGVIIDGTGGCLGTALSGLRLTWYGPMRGPKCGTVRADVVEHAQCRASQSTARAYCDKYTLNP